MLECIQEDRMRGYSLLEAFTAQPAATQNDGIHMTIDNKFSRTLIERTDPRDQVAYGIKHTPHANVKIFNASRNGDASIAFSFTAGNDLYDDIFKIVKLPGGGYELHLQKISAVVYDGKRIDTRMYTMGL